MKNYKTRFQGYIYINTDMDKATTEALFRQKVESLGDYTSCNGIYLQDMNELRDKQYYQKVDGEYHPLRSEYDVSGLTKGTYIMEIKPGSTSYRRMVENPARDEVEAALNEFKDELATLITEAQSAKPIRKLTTKQKKAWDDFIKKAGKDFCQTLQIESSAETADKLVALLRKKIVEKQKETVSQ
jgi:hypothetical protein